MSLSIGSPCCLHFFCSCGKTNFNCKDYRLCHYCRKKKYFYRDHYICVDCKIGFKSLYHHEIRPNAERSELYKYENINEINFEGKRCSKCGKDAIRVSFDFRVPKKKNLKEWEKIKNEIQLIGEYEFFEKYSYECGGSYFIKKQKLYDQRSKNPWTFDVWINKHIS
ncbi:MAG: hypothetical protein Satyrvirus41_6 [Satyrvirus sp.]|uniref:Uncharacterized protein n=1 Tax=Satyrvirus sp. TaxID=2487771 RepID=A0A3G5AHL5_9VIRU|nr:MAG: hypothetical protein Satyrvirus41_6 [Satyrvirus sp.]